ncbi:hypothetical protein Q1695_003199 [Nippostrongylus brasiliensis]|nr:hypothetical protein Q1695_003199 [Nippostrongylus brasiliensis]
MPPKKIPAVTYELNDRILCKYGDLYYEGKIVNVSTEDKERIFTVHYQGWHKRHDAIIPESQSRNLFLPYTEQNLARAKAELQQAKLEKKRQKIAKIPRRSSAASDLASTSSSPAHSPATPARRRRTKVIKREIIEDVRDIKFYYGCLPPSLRDILEKDNDAVLNRRLLTKLPAIYPIDMMLCEFLSSYDIDIEWGVDKVVVSYGDGVTLDHINRLLRGCQMITDYFNMTIGKLLLYGPERDQYHSELLRQRLHNLNDTEGINSRPHLGSVVLPDNSTPVRHSSVFGLPHLLRLFEVFVEDFANLPQDAEPILSLKMMTSEFVVFLADNRDKYFSVRRDYEPQE